jgi:hypothetical protein
MKKSLLTAAVALLAWAAAEQRAAAWTKVNIGGGLNICIESTGRSRCLSYTSVSNPPPCGYCCGPCCGPALWDSLAAYPAYPPHAYAAAPAPATTLAPPPAHASAAAPSGPQQAAYYPPAAYNYGYSGVYTYGQGLQQAPSYWYDR